MYQGESFQVTLVSSACTDIFPGNNSSNFRNVLPKTLRIKDYECGLASLQYSDNFHITNKIEPVVTIPEGEDFFDLEKEDNKIIFFEYKVQFHNIRKEYSDYVTFVTNLNIKMQEQNCNVRILGSYLEEGPVFFSLNYQTNDDYKLYIDSNLASILGFSKQTFKAGAHQSNKEPNKELLESLSDSTLFAVEQRKYTLHTVELDQMTTPTLQDLVLEIVSSLTLSGAHIRMQADPVTSSIKIDTGHKYSYLRLSPFLNRYLGLDPSFSMNGVQDITVNRSVVDPGEILNLGDYLNRGPASKNLISRSVLVLAGVISENFFNNKFLPTIAVLNREPGDGHHSISFNPILYYPVSIADANSIQIQLLTEDLLPLRVQETPTTATLYFRKRKI